MLQPLHCRDQRQKLICPGKIRHAYESGDRGGQKEENEARNEAAQQMEPLDTGLKAGIVPLFRLHDHLLKTDGRRHLDQAHAHGEGRGNAVVLDAEQARDKQVARETHQRGGRVS